MTWDTAYRPLRFSDVLGQTGAIKILKSRLANGSAFDTNYIFAGPWGCGKTTLAKIMARAMLCLNRKPEDQEPCNACENCIESLNGTLSACVEMDAASGGTIENMRSIVSDLAFVLPNAPKRVYILDESHRLSRDSQDVLLKPLEERRMVGIFCTTEVEKIRGAIRSRCEEYHVRKVTREDILVRMKAVLEKEKVPYVDDAVLTVIDFSGGHVRDILNRLEMISQMGEVNLETVREYLNLSAVSLYYEILLSLSDPKKAIALVEQVCEKVPVEDVLSGIAEAAMNSFRLERGMFADFAYVDKALAAKVYATYQDNTIKLAEYFLRNRFPTKVSLLCDIVDLQAGIPTTQAATQIVLAPVAGHGQPASAAVVQSATIPSTEKPPVVDDYSLTTLDSKVIGGVLPRREERIKKQPINWRDTDDGQDTILGPDRWKQEFAAAWAKK